MKRVINSYDCQDCKHCFTENPIFDLLNDTELESLIETRMEVDFKEGEIIYKQGTPLTHIVIINSGLGKIYIEGSKSKNIILTYSKPFDLNGGVGVFIDQRHHSSLMAVTECSACFVEIRAFKSIMRSNYAFMEAYIKVYSERVLHSYEQISVLTQKNMEGRMADSLIYLTNNIFNNGSIKYVSKQDLSELTAMTKESAIRVLKEFKEDGIIEIVDQKINILDQKALEQVARHG